MHIFIIWVVLLLHKNGSAVAIIIHILPILFVKVILKQQIYILMPQLQNLGYEFESKKYIKQKLRIGKVLNILPRGALRAVDNGASTNGDVLRHVLTAFF